MEDENVTKVLKQWGVMPEKQENDLIRKIGDACDDGDEFRVEAMLSLEGRYGIYYLMYGKILNGGYCKLTTSATLSKTITELINTTRDFKVPFTIKIKQGINAQGQEYTAGTVVL